MSIREIESCPLSPFFPLSFSRYYGKGHYKYLNYLRISVCLCVCIYVYIHIYV